MRQPLYHAKKSDQTEKGSRYTILQDGPASFHVSVQRGDNLIYEHFEQPESLEWLMSQIERLEEELISTLPPIAALPQS
jgi:hypothetical protein